MNDLLEMSISGSGTIVSGEYGEVKISGSGKIHGDVRCKSFKCSGSGKGEGNIVCEGKTKVSGSMRLTGNIMADEIHVDGSLRNDGELKAAKEVKISGLTEAVNIHAEKVRVGGKLILEKDLEAEECKIAGVIDCKGMINAETVEIELGGQDAHAGSIVGSNIRVWKEGASGIFHFPKGDWDLKVDEMIEGDEVDINHVLCPEVSGRNVKIGKKCKIDVVKYTDSLEIAEGAEVKNQIKVE